MTEITIGSLIPKLVWGVLNLLTQLLIYMESPFIIYNNSRHIFSIPPLNIEIETNVADFLFDFPSFEISMLTVITTSLLLTVLIIGILRFFIVIIKFK